MKFTIASAERKITEFPKVNTVYICLNRAITSEPNVQSIRTWNHNRTAPFMGNHLNTEYYCWALIANNKVIDALIAAEESVKKKK